MINLNNNSLHLEMKCLEFEDINEDESLLLDQIPKLTFIE